MANPACAAADPGHRRGRLPSDGAGLGLGVGLGVSGLGFIVLSLRSRVEGLGQLKV